MTPHGQNLACGARIVLNGAGSDFNVPTLPVPAPNPGKWRSSGGSGFSSKYLDSGNFCTAPATIPDTGKHCGSGPD